MSRIKLTGLLAALAGLLSLPILAFAAPAREATLNAEQQVYEWTGTKTTAETTLFYHYAAAGPCGEPPANYCDDTLLKIDDSVKPTSLIVEIPATGDNDFDIYVYKSNESGETPPNSGAGLSNEEAPSAEKVTIADPAGYYLVRVVYFAVEDAAYPAKATLKGLPAPTPTPTPAGGGEPTPQPTPQPTPAPAPAPAPAPPASQPQTGTLTASMTVKRTKLAAAAKRGLPVTVTCSRDCKGTVALEVDKKTARKLKLKSRALGKGAFVLDKAGSRALKVRLSKKAARALRKARSVKLAAIATVSDPKRAQTVTVRRSATLKR